MNAHTPDNQVVVSALTSQVKQEHRVNVFIDGSYRFSLDVSQVIELGVKVGSVYTEAELQALEDESAFGKLYGRALEYCLMRLHSAKEVRDYLWRKTMPTIGKDGRKKPGVSRELTDRVYERLLARGYIDDERFARAWVEHRSMRKGVSRRKLENELRAKGIEPSLIARCLQDSDRHDTDELQKVIQKKQGRYPDEKKFIAYLMRQGFLYEDITSALTSSGD